VEREKSIAKKYNINPLPDSWFLSEKGDVIGNRPGYLTAGDLMPVLQFIKTESFLKMSYRQFKESL
jgi:thioredoxin-related protein